MSASGQWQPIQTVPKDVEVLFFRPEEKPKLFAQMFPGRMYADGDGDVTPSITWEHGCGCCSVHDRPLPTHWKPLPEPPA